MAVTTDVMPSIEVAEQFSQRTRVSPAVLGLAAGVRWLRDAQVPSIRA
jgi:hypothetical protein